LFILKREKNKNFSLHKKISCEDLLPFVDEANMTYFFQKGSNNFLIMCREDCIFAVDTEQGRSKLIYEFNEPLDMQPRIFLANDD
jgi:hypothetical protein